VPDVGWAKGNISTFKRKEVKMHFKVKQVLYNEIPNNEEEILELLNLLELIEEHIKKGMKFRIVIEELEKLEAFPHPPSKQAGFPPPA